MRLRILLGALAGTAALAACDSSPTEFRCGITQPEATTQGDTTVLSTGVRYVRLQEGTGAEHQPCQAVSVHYEGRLTDGTVFDNSRNRNQPLAFVPGFGQLIPGFEQGVMGMNVGEIRRLIIPPALAYGAQGVTDQATGKVIIPPNATLVFDVELLAVTE